MKVLSIRGQRYTLWTNDVRPAYEYQGVPTPWRAWLVELRPGYSMDAVASLGVEIGSWRNLVPGIVLPSSNPHPEFSWGFELKGFGCMVAFEVARAVARGRGW